MLSLRKLGPGRGEVMRVRPYINIRISHLEETFTINCLHPPYNYRMTPQSFLIVTLAILLTNRELMTSRSNIFHCWKSPLRDVLQNILLFFHFINTHLLSASHLPAIKLVFGTWKQIVAKQQHLIFGGACYMLVTICFAYINSFNPHNRPVEWKLLFYPFT